MTTITTFTEDLTNIHNNNEFLKDKKWWVEDNKEKGFNLFVIHNRKIYKSFIEKSTVEDLNKCWFYPPTGELVEQVKKFVVDTMREAVNRIEKDIERDELDKLLSDRVEQVIRERKKRELNN